MTTPGDDAEGQALATELRREIDELRRVLDEVENAPLSPPGAARRRGFTRVAVVGAVVAVLLAAVLIAAFALFGSARGDDSATTAPSGGATSPTGTRTATSTPAVTAGALPVPQDSPRQGPGIDAPGSYSRVALAASGDLDVYESTVVRAPANRTLVLDARLAARTRQSLPEISPVVKSLQVTVNGEVVRATATREGLWSVPLPAGKAEARVQARYLVSGAVMRSTPSTTGRALGLFTPLTARSALAADTPVIVFAASVEVKGVSCVGAPTREALCGTRTDGGWRATVPPDASSPTVLLQADLLLPG